MHKNLLSINNYYYRRGGADLVFLRHNKMFSDNNWNVIPFSMKHPNNLNSTWSDFFIDEIEYGFDYSLSEKLIKTVNSIYSFQAINNLRKMLNLTKVDICHCHNIYHHISPSILSVLKSKKIPIVMTLHDLKLACPSYSMLNRTGICEKCKSGRAYNVMVNKCIKDSVLLSSIIFIEHVLHRALKSYDCVDKFIVPSNFYINKFKQWGYDKDRFSYVPNYVDCEKFLPEYTPGNYFVYFGRLSKEKGLTTLITAAIKSKIKLKIVGDGPDRLELENIDKNRNSSISFEGYLKGKSLHDVIKKAKACILPSEWYENAPLSILESYAFGKPVIGSNIGGIPELVTNGITGDTFTIGNVDELSDLLAYYNEMADQKIIELGCNGRKLVENKFSAPNYLQKIRQIYSDLIED